MTVLKRYLEKALKDNIDEGENALMTVYNKALKKFKVKSFKEIKGIENQTKVLEFMNKELKKIPTPEEE